MKNRLFSLLSLIVLVNFSALVSAQAQETGGGGGGHLAFLSADDRSHLMKVRQQVLDTNPALKAEQESLNKERESLKSSAAGATNEDRQTFRQNFMAHNEKMDAAMRAADPTVGPILDQVKAKMQERFQQHAAGN